MGAPPFMKAMQRKSEATFISNLSTSYSEPYKAFPCSPPLRKSYLIKVSNTKVVTSLLLTHF